MAAYEVLLLNTAVPQIQAAQSGDTYVVPRDIAFSTVASFAAGTEALPSLVATGDVNTGFWFPAADTIAASTGGTRRLTLDASGNLGLGVTPSAWSGIGTTLQVNTGGSFSADAANAYFAANSYYNGTNWIYQTTNNATRYTMAANSHIWYTAPSGTAGNAISFTQAMTLDASGNLGLGTTNPAYKLDINTTANSFFTGIQVRNISNGSSAVASIALGQDTNLTSSAIFVTSSTNTGYGGANSFNIYQGLNAPMAFFTNGTERARITSGGYFKASNSGTYNGASNSYHENYNSASDEWITWFQSAPATNPKGLRVYYSAAAPNGTANHFLYCDDTGGQRASIRSNGGLANYQSNNVDLSDARTKTDISPLGSYWNKIAGLEIVTYKYKDQTHDDLNIGVIAQQVEAVAPEFVDSDGFGETPEDGVPLKTIYNKDLTFAAIKALQEAMARIETLEAKIAALEAK